MGTLEESVEFIKNPDPRCPCVLLLDTSGSMAGTKIEQLSGGLIAFQQDINQDPLASRRCEIAIVTFGNGGRINVVRNMWVCPRQNQRCLLQ